MGVDEADLPARQPERSVHNPAGSDSNDNRNHDNHNTTAGGGLLETPSPPVVTHPGAVHVRQLPPPALMTLNKLSKRRDKDECTTTLEEYGESNADNSSPPTSILLECAPSRQSSSKPLLLGPQGQHQQQGIISEISGTANSTTTATTATSYSSTDSSRPGVFAVSGVGTGAGTARSNATFANRTTSMTSNTTTSHTLGTADTSTNFPPTTIITATKVDEEDEEDRSNSSNNKAVRQALEEAEQLRQQVRSLQQERQRAGAADVESSQVVVVATPQDDKDTSPEDDEDDDDAKSKYRQTWCFWIGGLVLSLGVAIGGGMAIFRSLQNDERTMPMAPATLSPTNAPTLPCLHTIMPPADKNSTDGTLQPVILLQICQGDCNDDTDCEEGLMCYHRSTPYDPVPGCSCWEQDATRNDYCIPIPTDPCLVETNDYPLGQCEGRCKEDRDCQSGLVCQAFFPGQLVMGCQECKGEDEEEKNDWNENVNGFFPGFVPDDNEDNNDTDVWALFNETIADGGSNTNETADADAESKLPEVPPFNTDGNNDNNNNDTEFMFSDNGFFPDDADTKEGGGDEYSSSSISVENLNETETESSFTLTDPPRILQSLLEEEEEEGPIDPSLEPWNGTTVDEEWTKPPSTTDDELSNAAKEEGDEFDFTRPPNFLGDDILNYVMYCVPAPDTDGSLTIGKEPGEGDLTADQFPGSEEGMSGVVPAGGTGLFSILLAVVIALLAW